MLAESASFEVTASARSTWSKEDSKKLHITLRNDTEEAVGVAWVNYKGVVQSTKGAPCAVIEPSATWSKGTYTTHPWSIMNPESNMEVCRVRFVEGGTLNISEIFAAQGSTTRARQQAHAKSEAHNVVEVDPEDEEAETIPGIQETLQSGEGSVVEGGDLALGKVYHLHIIEGWRVWMETGVEDANPTLRERLVKDLAEVNRVYPKAAVELLQKQSGFWMNTEYHYPGEKRPRSGMVTHYGSYWLTKKGNLACKALCVEEYKASTYAINKGICPAVLVHELSHAFEANTARRTTPILKAAYEKAIVAGTYDNGEYMGRPIKEGKHWTGKLNRRPYGAKNYHEYFAEACECFFSSNRFRNEFFPYIHAEMKDFDPIAYKMIEDAFEISGDDVISRGEVPEDWINKLAKISMEETKQMFNSADKDGNGTLDESEFCGLIEMLGIEGLTAEEVSAMITLADANKDGRVDVEEMLTWIAARATPSVAEGQEKVLECFRRYDADGSGAISREELTAVLKALENWKDEAIDQLLKEADASGDGQLQLQEFVSWLFAEADPERAKLCPPAPASE